MAIAQCGQALRHVETKHAAVVSTERTRHEHVAIVRDGDEPPIERGVEVRGQQEAVEDVPSSPRPDAALRA